MFGKFVTESRTAVTAAREIASILESPTVEAEHLLLALARQPATTAHQLLVDAYLDYDQLREALDAEFEGSLASIGITLADFDLSATPASSRFPRWGASAKAALGRAAKIAGSRRGSRVTPGHLLLGILRAPVGTVPRALDRAGVDRTKLGQRVAEAL